MTLHYTAQSGGGFKKYIPPVQQPEMLLSATGQDVHSVHHCVGLY